MLNLKYSLIVDVTPLWISLASTSTEHILLDDFVANLIFYTSRSIVRCGNFHKKYVEFNNEEDLMKFFLSFDENNFYKVYDDLSGQRRDQALKSILKQANEVIL